MVYVRRDNDADQEPFTLKSQVKHFGHGHQLEGGLLHAAAFNFLCAHPEISPKSNSVHSTSLLYETRSPMCMHKRKRSHIYIYIRYMYLEDPVVHVRAHLVINGHSKSNPASTKKKTRLSAVSIPESGE